MSAEKWILNKWENDRSRLSSISCHSEDSSSAQPCQGKLETGAKGVECVGGAEEAGPAPPPPVAAFIWASAASHGPWPWKGF